ncbi:hypothetical protein HDU67_008305, partial [Dinochytrium kinnereticum]
MAPSLLTTAAALAVAVPVSLVAYFHIKTRRPKVKLPYPPPAPVMGSTYDVLFFIDQRFETFTAWAKKYGPTWTMAALTLSDFHIVMTVDPAVVEYILKTNFDNYVKGERLHSIFMPLLGDGIFSSDGHQWKWQRKVSSHIFTGRNFRDVVEKVIHEDIEKLVQALTNAADSGKKIDLHLYLHCFTMDTFGKIGFGQDLRSLNDPDNPPPFAKAFDAIIPVLNVRFPNPIWGWTEYLSGTKATLKKNFKIIDDFVYERVREKRERKGVEEGAHKDLLDLYMAYDAELTDVQLRDMIMNMMLAGRDTTAQALSWAFWLLSSRPEIVAKIREEVQTILGESRLPTYDEVNSLKYVNAVFYETLRLYPSVPLDFKTSVKPDVLPGGIEIPANTEVNWFPYSMGRMEALWGPDANDFNPNRWLDPVTDTLRRESQFKWTAFNAGPRTCLGQQMATVEGVMTLVAL